MGARQLHPAHLTGITGSSQSLWERGKVSQPPRVHLSATQCPPYAVSGDSILPETNVSGTCIASIRRLLLFPAFNKKSGEYPPPGFWAAIPTTRQGRLVVG